MPKEFSQIMKLVRHPDICNGNLHPISSQIDLSTCCTLACVFCVSAKEIKKQTMSVALLSKILDKFYGLGCKGIEYTGGGEPLTHPNFVEIIRKTSERFDVGLITNGTLIEKFEKEVWKKFDWIRVSVNAGPSNYKRIHGKDRFANVLEGLSILDSVAPCYGVSYIYSGQEVSDISELAKQLKSLKNLKYLRIAQDVFKPLPDLNTMQGIFDGARSCLNSNVNVTFQMGREMWIPDRCLMYKIKPRIDVSGNLYPCCVSNYKGIHSQGSVLDFDFAKEATVDTRQCPYCIYGAMNNFCCEVEKTDVKNKNFI
jgi:MoaA/NifB/PqqE/SkfB family radical SAM enzyme